MTVEWVSKSGNYARCRHANGVEFWAVMAEGGTWQQLFGFGPTADVVAEYTLATSTADDLAELGAMFASGPDADWEAERFPDRHDPECFACAVCCL